LSAVDVVAAGAGTEARYPPGAEEHAASVWSVFFALLRRDLRVARKELVFFLVRTTMQPLLFLVVFGYLLPKMNFVGKGYQTALLPGILAVSLSLSAIQSVALPMVQDFGWTKEIEDRLLAPVPTLVIAAEKIVSAMLQGFIAAAFVLPIARLVMGPIPALTLSHGGEVVIIVLLGSLAFSSLGMWLGTAIAPQQIGLMFSVIIAPMLFFGCAYYPWRGLDVVPVMKYLVLVNPMVYVAEGMRGALTPAVPHMPLAVVVVALLVISAFFWTLGTRSFFKRAIG
jgi:ABC-2 type transport system permease protein